MKLMNLHKIFSAVVLLRLLIAGMVFADDDAVKIVSPNTTGTLTMTLNLKKMPASRV